jgi:hypothetical protein
MPRREEGNPRAHADALLDSRIDQPIAQWVGRWGIKSLPGGLLSQGLKIR